LPRRGGRACDGKFFVKIQNYVDAISFVSRPAGQDSCFLKIKGSKKKTSRIDSG
jgi:hypothetical protein